MTIYDSDKPPSDLNEAEDRIREAIIWEFLDEECGLLWSHQIPPITIGMKRLKKDIERLLKKLKQNLCLQNRQVLIIL